MQLPPHELVEVRVQHRLVNPLHTFEPLLHAIPIGFDVLCVDPCCWVHKGGVVHCLVVAARLQLLDPVVGCPLFAVNLGPRPDMASDDGEESLCSTVWYNAHDPQCW